MINIILQVALQVKVKVLYYFIWRSNENKITYDNTYTYVY